LKGQNIAVRVRRSCGFQCDLRGSRPTFSLIRAAGIAGRWTVADDSEARIMKVVRFVALTLMGSTGAFVISEEPNLGRGRETRRQGKLYVFELAGLKGNGGTDGS
jgi:hypothetical protein